ncbi:unnamed protein product [Phaeothamnion confervicola]
MADTLKSTDRRVARLCAFWEDLSPATLSNLSAVYHQQIHFCDPFNDVHGITHLHALLERMFQRLHEPRFVVHEVALQDDGAVLIWDFYYRLRNWQPQRARSIHGLTHVRFGDDGRVIEHRDYWDAAAQVYAHLPLLGRVLRWLQARLG